MPYFWKMPKKQKSEKPENFPENEADVWVDDRQKRYMKTEKGKTAAEKARQKYDNKDLERRRRQKREYMRRKRLENPDIWRD